MHGTPFALCREMFDIPCQLRSWGLRTSRDRVPGHVKVAIHLRKQAEVHAFQDELYE